MPQAPKQVHLFDLIGTFIKSFRGAAECADYIGSQRQTVTNAATRKSLINGTYYVGYDKEFTLPEPKYENNRERLVTRSPKRDRRIAITPGKKRGRSVRSLDSPIFTREAEDFLGGSYFHGY